MKSHIKILLFTLVLFSNNFKVYSQIKDKDGKDVIVYSSIDKTINLKDISIADFLEDYISKLPENALEDLNFSDKMFVVMADTIILDNITSKQDASYKGNYVLPFKNLGLFANNLILRGVNTFNLNGDLNGSIANKSGGDCYLFANNIFVEDTGGLFFNLKGSYKTSNKVFPDNYDNGNGGNLYLSYNNSFLNTSEIYKMNKYFMDFYSSTFEELYPDSKILDNSNKIRLDSCADLVYTDVDENKKIKNLIASSTNFNTTLRKIFVNAQVNSISSGLKNNSKKTLDSQNLRFWNYDIQKGNIISHGSQGSFGTVNFYRDNDNAIDKNEFIKKLNTEWILMELKDLQNKIQKAIQSQNKADLYKLFLKYSQLKIYDVDQDKQDQLTLILQSLNDERKNNILPINIQKINSDLEEEINLINIGTSTNYFLLPNRIVLNTWKINNTDYSGIVKFTPSGSSKFEIYLTAQITASFYAETQAKNQSGLPPLKGKYAGIFTKLNFTDASFGAYGINKNDSYCRISNNNVFIKISFDETKDEDVLFALLLNNGIPLKIKWEFDEDKNYGGELNFMLRANSVFNNNLSSNENTVINNSRFPVILNYVVLNDSTLKNFNPAIKFNPKETKDLSSNMSIGKKILFVPFDGMNIQYSNINNGLYQSTSSEIVKEIKLRNLLPLVKNGDEIKNVTITISWIDENNLKKDMILNLLPQEEKTINIFYPEGGTYKYTVSGMVDYAHSQYKIKEFESSDLSISIDNSNIDNN